MSGHGVSPHIPSTTSLADRVQPQATSATFVSEQTASSKRQQGSIQLEAGGEVVIFFDESQPLSRQLKPGLLQLLSQAQLASVKLSDQDVLLQKPMPGLEFLTDMYRDCQSFQAVLEMRDQMLDGKEVSHFSEANTKIFFLALSEVIKKMALIESDKEDKTSQQTIEEIQRIIFDLYEVFNERIPQGASPLRRLADCLDVQMALVDGSKGRVSFTGASHSKTAIAFNVSTWLKEGLNLFEIYNQESLSHIKIIAECLGKYRIEIGAGRGMLSHGLNAIHQQQKAQSVEPDSQAKSDEPKQKETPFVQMTTDKVKPKKPWQGMTVIKHPAENMLSKIHGKKTDGHMEKDPFDVIYLCARPENEMLCEMVIKDQPFFALLINCHQKVVDVLLCEILHAAEINIPNINQDLNKSTSILLGAHMTESVFDRKYQAIPKEYRVGKRQAKGPLGE